MDFDLNAWLAFWRQQFAQDPRGLATDAKFSAELAGCPEALCVMTEDWDGHLRERALRLLRQHEPSQMALQAILQRLNDWVPNVRQQAERCFRDYLHPAHLPLLLMCLDELLVLQRKTRQDHSVLLAEVQQALQAPNMQALLLRALPQHKSHSARFLLQILLAVQPCPPEVGLAALRHVDPSVRLLIVRALAEGGTASCLSLLELAMQDRLASVRSQALRGRLQWAADPAERLALCQRLLLDASVGPRAVAIWYAEAAGMDVTAWYRSALQRGETDACQALLHEAVQRGLEEGIVLALAHRHDPVVKTRCLAMVALLRLQPAKQDEWAMAGITDPAAKIRKRILTLLRSEITVDAVQLEPAFALYANNAWSVTGVLMLFSPWRRVVLVLEWLQSFVETQPPAGLFTSITTGLAYTQPTAAERERIVAALGQARVRELLGCDFLIQVLQRQGLW